MNFFFLVPVLDHALFCVSGIVEVELVIMNADLIKYHLLFFGLIPNLISLHHFLFYMHVSGLCSAEELV